MAEVRLGSRSNRLVLDVQGPVDQYADAVLVTLLAPGLSASLVVHAFDDYLKILVGFVGGLERSFRGWVGERTYESFEGDLRIVATHLGGVVRLAVRLTSNRERVPWTAQADVLLEPGEELRHAARDVADLIRPDQD